MEHPVCNLIHSTWHSPEHQGIETVDSPTEAVKYSARMLICMCVAGVSFNQKGKKKLAHPDYQPIQSMWHSTHNQGKVPADITHNY